jgi:chitinase
MMADVAPGLLSCSQLASDIDQCQKMYGKKILLSIGGATGNIVFRNDGEAQDFADVLWKIFGPTGDIDDGLRPFGDVVIDGFDIGISRPP